MLFGLKEDLIMKALLPVMPLVSTLCSSVVLRSWTPAIYFVGAGWQRFMPNEKQ